MGTDETALSQLHPFGDPAGGHQVQSLGEGLGGPDPTLTLGQAHVQLYLAGQSVTGAVQIGLAVPHVPPVALQGQAEEGGALPEHGGEQVLAEVPGRPLGDPVHCGGGENIDAGVDLVSEHLAPPRLLHKALHPAVLPGEHQAVLQGRLVVVQSQCGLGPPLPVELHQGGQVQVADTVPADDQKVLVPQLVHAAFYAACRPQRFLLGEPGQPPPQPFPAAEIVHDGLGLVAQGYAQLGDAVGSQQIDNVLHHRPAQQRGHGLGTAQRQRPQPGPLTARHYDRFHLLRHPSVAS